MNNKLKNLLYYVVSAEITGALSALLTGSFSSFFNMYKEPPLLPPAWLFPVVWVILYALMGISAHMIHDSSAPDDDKKSALSLYWFQLFFNFLWSIIFFRFEALWLAFADISLLIVLVIGMISAFRKVRPTAAGINIPYLLWILFAAYLNLSTALIN